ncbi:carboxylesterase 1C-like [Mercenaria mercenaria]|uniref:carboxylesterase 1C-like n=1 Tax=Mercenaria mercenaria TaxID=6596 RepID=UPI00234E8903|nr:carboxylesterase 1C-like [Mercenaria mercenaria]
MPHILQAVGLSLIFIAHYVRSDGPVVETKLGTVTGIQYTFVFNGVTYNVSRYLGLPFAKPPVGNLRFQKPAPYGNFTNNTLQAKSFGHSCVQYDPMGNEPDQSEDCLFLNVFVPEQTPDNSSRHAVMIFVHGGGLVTGSAKQYPADTLASVGNVIVVTINYRLWLFGFLDMDTPSAPGNMGHWDQHIAFKWVSDNIHSFGGDPERITIFGQSAGSTSVTLQSMYPENHMLFRGVITESGTISLLTQVMRSENINLAMLMAEKMKCNTTSMKSKESILKCFQETSAEKFVETLANTLMNSPMEGRDLYSFFTTIDGEFLKRNPLELLKDIDGLSDEVQFLRSLNLINGFNTDEGSLWVMGLPGGFEDTFNISRESMNSVHIPSMYPIVFGPDTEIPDVVKGVIAQEYTDWRAPDDPVYLLHQFSKMNGDIYMGVPAIEYSRLHAHSTNTSSYLYHFEAAMNGHAIASPRWVQASAHGDELAPLFGFQFPKLAKNMTVILPEGWEKELSERLIGYWTAFAKYGNPNGQRGDNWPTYNITDQKYMKIDRTDNVGQYLYARETDFWRELIPSIKRSAVAECSDSGPISSASTGTVEMLSIVFVYACALMAV